MLQRYVTIGLAEYAQLDGDFVDELLAAIAAEQRHRASNERKQRR